MPTHTKTRWQKHVAKFRKDHPNVPGDMVMQAASKTYKKDKDTTTPARRCKSFTKKTPSGLKRCRSFTTPKTRSAVRRRTAPKKCKSFTRKTPSGLKRCKTYRSGVKRCLVYKKATATTPRRCRKIQYV